jgi:hypothetical protein
MTTTNIQRRLTVGMMAFSLLIGSRLAAGAQEKAKAEAAAQQSAEAWLALVDAGDYGGSWQQSAEAFKSAVSQEKWESALQGTRSPLGKILSRKLKSASYTKTLPGAPDGEYVVIQYESSFEHKQAATETIVPMLEKDGKWRISGYFIK